MPEDALIIRGAREHNLRDVDLTIPRDRLTVITGLSGSGKSSLAFDTIYAEGQRRYVESLSAYARQFLGLMEKPDVDLIEGLSPAISIEQKSAGHNPRSTVGTVTEIYDYLRLLYARAGTPHCPECGRAVQRQSPAQIAETDPRLARRHARSKCSRRWSGAQGRVPRPVRERAQAGVRPRDRGRRRSWSWPSRRSSTVARTTPSRWSSTAWWCAPRIAAASPIPWRRRSRLADGVVEIVRMRRSGDGEAPKPSTTSSPSATAARAAASRCPSSSRATSPSTRRSAPARRAADSAPAAR